MIHRALMGSFERFIGILIEHYAGEFPVWLAPVQAIALPIADRHNDAAGQVVARLREAGLRAELDDRTESVGRKIREAELRKIPFMLVVGDREAEEGTVAVRRHGVGDEGSVPVDEFVARLRRDGGGAAMTARAATRSAVRGSRPRAPGSAGSPRCRPATSRAACASTTRAGCARAGAASAASTPSGGPRAADPALPLGPHVHDALRARSHLARPATGRSCGSIARSRRGAIAGALARAPSSRPGRVARIASSRRALAAILRLVDRFFRPTAASFLTRGRHS